MTANTDPRIHTVRGELCVLAKREVSYGYGCCDFCPLRYTACDYECEKQALRSGLGGTKAAQYIFIRVENYASLRMGAGA